LEAEYSTEVKVPENADSTKYVLEGTTTTDYQAVLRISSDYIQIEGLQVLLNYSHANSRTIHIGHGASGSNSANHFKISHNIIRGDATGNNINGSGFDFNSDNQRISFWNNIVYGFLDDNSASGTCLLRRWGRYNFTNSY